MLGTEHQSDKLFKRSELRFVYLENTDVRFTQTLRFKYTSELHNSNCIVMELAIYRNVLRLCFLLSNLNYSEFRQRRRQALSQNCPVEYGYDLGEVSRKLTNEG